MTKSETVEILRDTWGVPHIYAESEVSAIYAQGYAMAQDRLPSVLRVYRKATGRMAEAFGPEWIEHDLQQRIWRHEQVARALRRAVAPPPTPLSVSVTQPYAAVLPPRMAWAAAAKSSASGPTQTRE